MRHSRSSRDFHRRSASLPLALAALLGSLLALGGCSHTRLADLPPLEPNFSHVRASADVDFDGLRPERPSRSAGSLAAVDVE